MRKTNKIIGLFVSDIHLQSIAPRARKKEPDWFEAMAKPLKQLSDLKEKYNVPIFCAGDIFDKWKSDPELINFALTYLPEMYAIPGQHELPLHNMDLIKRSAFWTMVLADKIHPVFKPYYFHERDIVLHGFPWGSKIKPCKVSPGNYQIAICHDYFWMDKHCYPKAPKEQNVSGFKKLIKGYDAVAFGDNHKGFITKVNDISVINCGTLMRRKSDEKDYRPQIGVLHSDGDITPHYLDTSGEIIHSLEEEESEIRNTLQKTGINMDYFLTHLNELKRTSFDFKEKLLRTMTEEKTRKPVKDIIIEALEL